MTAGTITALGTKRLMLRPLVLDDAPAIQATFPQWEIVRFLASHVPWPYPSDGAESFLRDVALPGIVRGEEWHWSLRPKSEPERLIGVISLMARENNNRGFWIAPDWQGQGLMSEAAAASPISGSTCSAGTCCAHRKQWRTWLRAASPSAAACG